MKRVLLAVLALCLGLGVWAADPPRPVLGSVYVMPMLSGYDQYLANQLNRRGYTVVTTPKLAQFLMTDSIGDALERQLKKIEEEQQPAAPAPAEDPEDAKLTAQQRAKRKRDAEYKAAEEDARRMSDLEAQRPVSTFSRGRGNIFVVDVASRRVVWSNFDRAKRRTPEKLDDKAGDVVRELTKSWAPAASK